MNILVLNCGSSSVKFSAFYAEDGVLHRRVSGLIDAIAKPDCCLKRKFFSPDISEERISHQIPDCNVSVYNYDDAVTLILKILLKGDSTLLPGIETPGVKAIDTVAHRVVHGGETFMNPVIIDDNVIEAIKANSQHAPLHNPINLAGIEAVSRLLPAIRQVAVFDTAFHQSIPAEAFLYAIPYSLYETHKIRRYGFHGISCQYVYDEAARFLNKNPKDFKAIICHLGSGASITAVDGGRSVDTSMGMTPLEGLVMGTRCGDLDPSIIPFLCRETGMDISEVEDMLNRQSGLLGLSGTNNDLRHLLKARLEAKGKDAEKCDLAISVYIHRIIRYIGAFVSVLNGIDAIIFTAGAGEGSSEIRKRIMDRLGWLNISINHESNQKALSGTTIISAPDSGVTVLAVPTDEEKQIAKEALSL
jgi:acetate kinase